MAIGSLQNLRTQGKGMDRVYGQQERSLLLPVWLDGWMDGWMDGWGVDASDPCIGLSDLVEEFEDLLTLHLLLQGNVRTPTAIRMIAEHRLFHGHVDLLLRRTVATLNRHAHCTKE
eukprot:scaffold625_cov324-Pavlova_lutheri.AAC.66